MLGLTLEGGGSRGAFQIGAVKAFLENGYTFDGVTGTSIGALNGAMIAQGDTALASEMWESMEMSKLFPTDDDLISKLKEGDFSKGIVSELLTNAKSLISSGGVDTSRIRDLLDGKIDEKKLRESKTDFGLVTVSIADRKALSVFKERIPKGMLVDYLIASAMLPIFKNEKDVGRKFVDGSYYDVCPYNMLIDKGYEEIVVIRLFGIGVLHKPKRDDVKFTFVVPSEKLPNILDFTSDNIKRIMTMGYYDALRVIKKCQSVKYCIIPLDRDTYEKLVFGISDETIVKIARLFALPELPPRRLLFECILPIIAHCLKLDENFDYGNLLCTALESLAASCEIDRFAVYCFDDLLRISLGATTPEGKMPFSEIIPAYRADEDFEKDREKTFRLPLITVNSSYDYRIPELSTVAEAVKLLLTDVANQSQKI